jgi:hypothetical protein
VGDVALRAQVAGSVLQVWQIAPPAPPVGGTPPAGEPDVVIVAGPGIRSVISGELAPADAVAQDQVAVVRGDADQLERFAEIFHIDPRGGIIAA